MDPAVVPGWARRAEAAGFSSVATSGRVSYPGLMDTVALAAAAGATSRVGLVSTVLVAPVWPPVLLAKELAGIDAVSGGRLTVGVGLGGRADDYVAEAHPARGRGRRLDADLEVYHRVWAGEPVGGGNPAVPAGTRPVPLIFGGTVPASFARMARWGAGYTTGGVPVPMVAGAFDAARAAWQAAGREGRPRLVAMAYFALGNPAAGIKNVSDYFGHGGDDFVNLVVGSLAQTADQVREAVRGHAEIGADELILHPTTDDPDEIERLAELVLPS
ncbi:LLM class flavin-dependent oxidoreductase [Paractinoplanes lichenicola]|nr:LLM class flavin-dependent oxidoreductase [Actinoplanes lichenicola]